MKKLIVVAACLASLTANAMTAEQAEKVRKLDQEVIRVISLCETANERGAAVGSAPRDCFTDNIKYIKAVYQKFAPSIKNKAAKETFKNYHIAVLAQAKAFEVIAGESERAFDMRQRAAKERSNEAWVRVEVEMGF